MKLVKKEKKLPKAKICFVSLGAYAQLANKNMNLVGGAELQQVLLARKLNEANFDVSFIVFDFGQESPGVVDGIKTFTAFRNDEPKGIRYSKIRLLWCALNQANADLYQIRGGFSFVGMMAFYCFLKRRKLVYSIAIDSDIDISQAESVRFYDYRLIKFGIKLANAIIAQTEYQRNLLKSKFNRDGLLIKNMYPLPPEKPEKEKPPILLWVATIRERKQPEMFLDLARAIPEARFQMIGGPAPENPQYSGEIKRAAIVIPNLDFVGFVPYHKVEQYFDRASIFVNTSAPDSEGFPNTFLQAWARYTPVVSLNCDPDEIICEKRLGFHSGTFEQAVNDVKLLLKNEKMRSEIGANGRKYVEEEHDIEKIISRYIGLFEQLTGQGDSVRRRMITL